MQPTNTSDFGGEISQGSGDDVESVFVVDIAYVAGPPLLF
jgi:hypothetical protein